MMRTLVAAMLATALGAAPAHAVIVLDSTWAEEGGTAARPGTGFGAHVAMAHEPQFAPAIAFSYDGEVWGECSGTWIGNDATGGFVLTAAHCFGPEADGTNYYYRSEGGAQYEGVELYSRSEYATCECGGYDIAIVKLDRPVTDAGAPAALYDGDAEQGKLLTFPGFGSRGIGSIGQNDAYYAPANEREQKAAGQGIVEEAAPAIMPMPADDPGNTLVIFLGKEDGSVENPYGGSAKPPTRLAALLGSGDSGSGAWMQLDDGRWVVAGVASVGSGNAEYGELSMFARVAHHKDWILKIVPTANFASDP